ncbi:hypothetical protein QO002_001083 [Pararhizobium capsulatum DSM 1112]|uniref:Uncharacterized protein n=1 Tax=Pararhizobium capsulatum DSM 1112 TaxID=1121113 RepID=A0ABU0BL12_9HYPH|nr:hypothetical protein [Pararhizobium capsulatum DSM 1112]
MRRIILHREFFHSLQTIFSRLHLLEFDQRALEIFRVREEDGLVVCAKFRFPVAENLHANLTKLVRRLFDFGDLEADMMNATRGDFSRETSQREIPRQAGAGARSWYLEFRQR